MQQIPDPTPKHTFWLSWTRRLIHLYPASWKERYADEMLALLEEQSPTFWTFLDLFLNLCDAHLHHDLFSARNLDMVKQFYTSVTTILSASILFYLFSSLMELNMPYVTKGHPLGMVAPPFLQHMIFISHNLFSVLGICLIPFSACLFLSTIWQTFKIRYLLSFFLTLFGVLCPALAFIYRVEILVWCGSLVWGNPGFLSSKIDALLLNSPLEYVYLFLPVLLVSFLCVRIGSRHVRAALRQTISGIRLTNALFLLAMLCTLLSFLYCCNLLFLMGYAFLLGFGQRYIEWIINGPDPVLFSVMILSTVISLMRAYQARHIFTIQKQ